MDDSFLKCQFPLPYYTLTLACLGITDQFLHSPYILRIEMGVGSRRAKLGQIQGGLQNAIQDSTKGGLQ